MSFSVLERSRGINTHPPIADCLKTIKNYYKVTKSFVLFCFALFKIIRH